MEDNKKNAPDETVNTGTAETAEKTEKQDRKKAKKADAEQQKKLDAALAERDEINERYLRMMAEYDNFRKRTAKEKEEIWADAYADCIGALLPILDNLERASQSDNFDAVKKGLNMTVKAFGDALTKMGVTEIETKTFDPTLHNAVMHIDDDQYGESEIVEVFQRGYCKGDKIIRHAMVKVAN